MSLGAVIGPETPIARVATRPRAIWTLCALDLLVAAVCFAAAFAPATMHKFVTTGVVCGSLFTATATTLWLVAFRINRTWLVGFAIAGVGILSFAVANSLTAQGALVGSFTYIWTTIYAASFFNRKQTSLMLVVIAAGSAAAFANEGMPRWGGIWVVFTLTTTVTGLTLERSVGQLRREAETDVLTGLLNRRGFLHAAALERSVSERIGATLALVLIDLDNFKAVNDLQGHAGGDRALVDATAAWQAQLREGDLLGRFGGDEFVLLLPHLPAPGVAAVIARCHEAHPISWTSGMSFLQPGEKIEDCMERADELLYQAKLHRGIAAHS